MKYKYLDPAGFSSGDHGEISGYFATFHHDHGDSYGDVLKKGCFAKTIEERKRTGHPFPLCFNHDFSVIIGAVTDLGEDDYGAWFKAKFFPTEKAQEIRNIVKSGVLWQFSFAYNVIDEGKVRAGDGSMVNELRELELLEISIVAAPANPRSVITDIKTDRERLLAFAEKIEREERERLEKAKAEALYVIDEYQRAEAHEQYEKIKADPVKLLAHLRGMEKKALEDIERYKKEGDYKSVSVRRGALKAIREQIREVQAKR